MVAAITRMGFVRYIFMIAARPFLELNFSRNCEEEAEKCMAEMDLDKDGKVSYAEFVIKWRVS